MRALLAPPRRKYESLTAASVGGLAHWKFGELGGGNPLDFYGVNHLSTASGGGGTQATTPKLYEADGTTVGKGITFAAGAFRGAAHSAGQLTAMLTHDISAEVTFEVTAGGLVGGTTNRKIIFGSATSSATVSTSANTPFVLYVTNTGALGVAWEYGTVTLQTVETDAGVIAEGTLYAVGVRRWFLGSRCIVDFTVNGRFVARRSSLNLPAGTATFCQWRVAGGTKIPTIADPLSCTIYEIRVMSDTNAGSGIRSIDFFRNDAARALMTFDASKLVKTQDYNAFARVMVFAEAMSLETAGVPLRTKRDDYPLIDLDAFDVSRFNESGGDYTLRHHIVENVDIDENIDGEGRSATFTCAREVYDWRYSPFYADTSPVSRANGIRVFDLARPMRIEIAIVPRDVEREEVEEWEWSTEFDGFMSNVSFGDATMSIACRDRMAPIQSTFCRPLLANAYKEAQYGDDSTGVALETVLQQIIDEHTPGTGFLGGKPAVYTPISPAWNLRKRNISFEPLSDVLTGKVEQIGWVLRHKWDDTAKVFRYTLFEPERVSPVVARSFAVNEYLGLTSAELNEDQIRNVCEVVYTNRIATASSTSVATAATDVVTHPAYDVTTFSIVRFTTTGTLPAPLVAGTDYWTIRQAAGSSKLATSLVNAQANTAIDITTAGVGVHTLTVFGATAGLGDFPRDRYIATDSTSIAQYGERYCQITEDAASQIDTAAEATQLGDSVVADLAQPKALLTMSLGCFPWAQLDDYYTISSFDHFDTAQSFAVISIKHTITPSKHSTALGLRGKPAGRADFWLGNLIAMPGLAPWATFRPLPDPIAPVVQALDGGLHVAWTWPVNNLRRNFDGAEVHMTTDVGAWTPSASTRVGYTRSDSMWIPRTSGPNTDVQTKIILRDRANNLTAAVAGTTRKPRPSLNDSPVGEVSRGDGSGTYLAAPSGVRLPFPTTVHNPYSAFSQGGGVTFFTAPWAGRYTFHVTARFHRNASASVRSNSYRLFATLNPTGGTGGTGSGGTLTLVSPTSGWVLPGLSAIGEAEHFAWTYSLQLSAGDVLVMAIDYGMDPSLYPRTYFDMVQDTGTNTSKWKAYFNGAGL